MKYSLKDFKGDILGAVSGGAVALPQSMGLGVVLFSVMGFSSAQGAAAGLLGAIVLLIVSGLVGATKGMISAPNGPITMLLVGVMSTLSSSGATNSLMLTTLSAILILTGIFQILISLFGGAKLIKYIPYPVVAGLVTGIGLLMIKSQIELLLKKHPSSLIDFFPFLIVLVSIIFMLLVPKITKNSIPGAIGALAGGVGSFFLLLDIFNINSQKSWIVGEIPSFNNIDFNFELSQFLSLNYELVISSALALAILGMMDCLVTALVADSKTKTTHNSTLEIIAQGFSQILIGLSHSLGGWGTKGATLVAIESGGRRFVAFFAGVFLFCLMLFGGFLGEYLPISVLAAIVGMVGFGMIDWDILIWLKYKNRRVDGLIALSVIVAAFCLNVVTAVGVGVGLSILFFIIMQSKEEIIYSKSTLLEYHSSRKRPKKIKELIEQNGKRVTLYELKGNLFFATADKLKNSITPSIKESVAVILHFRRVTYMDLSAMIVLLQLISLAKESRCELIFCHLHKRLGFGNKISKAFKHIKPNFKFENRVFKATDKALEYAEEILLKELGGDNKKIHICSPVFANDFCLDLNNKELRVIQRSGKLRYFKKKDTIFKEGEFGESIFLLLEGEVEIRLYSSKYIYKRLAIYSSGTYFGEIAFISPGKRSASAIVTKKSILFEISKRDILNSVKEFLSEINRYELFSKLLTKIAIKQSNEVRALAKEIRRLELL